MRLLKWVTLAVVILSLIVLLYGCIKLARFENNTPPPITVNIPGVTVEVVGSKADQDYAQRIVTVSASLFVVSLIGFGTLAWMTYRYPDRSKPTETP